MVRPNDGMLAVASLLFLTHKMYEIMYAPVPYLFNYFVTEIQHHLVLGKRNQSEGKSHVDVQSR